MPEQLLYILCGLSAGLLGGYLGIGGGIIMVPFLTVLGGIDIKAAVPVSVTAIVVTSLSSSNEYIKKGMVDLELVVILAIFMVLGNITGSSISPYVAGEYIQLVLTVFVIYAAISLLKNKNNNINSNYHDTRNSHIVISSAVALVTGIFAGLLGIGGGIVIVPVLYLLIGVPLSTARGTSSLMVGFSAAAASTVYLINGQIDFQIASGVILGIIFGGKLGGYLGAIAKPIVVKIIFFILMMYLAYELSYEPLKEFL